MLFSRHHHPSMTRGSVAGTEVGGASGRAARTVRRERGSELTTQAQPDASWAALADLDDERRQEAMAERFRELEKVPDEQRRTELAAMVSAENSLDDELGYDFVRSQLRVWARLAAEDLEKAKSIANGYEEIYAELTGTVAWRRATVVQTIARIDLSADEVIGISELVPSLTRQIPRARTNILERGADEAAALRRHREGLPFWKRIFSG